MNKPILLKDAAEDSSNPELQEVAKKILNGEISLNWCSPFPGMEVPWTEEKKAEFNAVLDKWLFEPNKVDIKDI